MITLHELVSHVLTEIGHLLVPINAFGFTYPRLEQLMITSLNKYQQYRPLHRKVAVSISGSMEFKDAQRVFKIRPLSTSPEYSRPYDFKDWNWDNVTQTLTPITDGDYYVEYLGKHTVELGTSITSLTDELFPEETQLIMPLTGHFKKGSLTITLDEGVIGSELFTVDINEDTFSVDNSSTLYSKITQNTIVRVSSDGTLPSPIQSSTDYYVIKKENGNYQLANSYDNANYTPKIFTTNFISNATYLTITSHGLSNNQAVQLSTTDTLPLGLSSDITYYVNVVNANTIELKPTTIGSAIILSSNGSGQHTLTTGFIDFTDIGTGLHTMTKQAFTLTEDLSSYNPSLNYITLSGTLGSAYVALNKTSVILPNQSVLTNLNTLDMVIHSITAGFVDPASLVITYNSQYKTIKELSLEDLLFVDLFKGELMKALGNSKAITKLEGLPFDVTTDDLYSKGEELINKTLEDLQNSRSRWWCFR